MNENKFDEFIKKVSETELATGEHLNWEEMIIPIADKKKFNWFRFIPVVLLIGLGALSIFILYPEEKNSDYFETTFQEREKPARNVLKERISGDSIENEHTHIPIQKNEDDKNTKQKKALNTITQKEEKKDFNKSNDPIHQTAHGDTNYWASSDKIVRTNTNKGEGNKENIGNDNVFSSDEDKGPKLSSSGIRSNESKSTNTINTEKKDLVKYSSGAQGAKKDAPSMNISHYTEPLQKVPINESVIQGVDSQDLFSLSKIDLDSIEGFFYKDKYRFHLGMNHYLDKTSNGIFRNEDLELHSIGQSFGIEFWKQKTKSLYLTSGVQFSRLHKYVELRQALGVDYNVFENERIVSQRVVRQNNYINLMQFQLGASWEYSISNRITGWINVNVEPGLKFSSTGQFLNPSTSSIDLLQNFDQKEEFILSCAINPGISYRISENVNFFINPAFSEHLREFSILENQNEAIKPKIFSMNFGLSKMIN